MMVETEIEGEVHAIIHDGNGLYFSGHDNAHTFWVADLEDAAVFLSRDAMLREARRAGLVYTRALRRYDA